MTTIHDTLDGLPALIRWEHARDLGLTRHEFDRVTQDAAARGEVLKLGRRTVIPRRFLVDWLEARRVA